MLKRAKTLARKENRTLSELMREAYREYESAKRWARINAYGQAKAAALGITEADVPRIVKEWRREQKPRSKRAS
jgi:response regulator RpfG family c-di-GMP phosphodiesterase